MSSIPKNHVSAAQMRRVAWDCDTLSATRLKARYKGEYSSWNNMKSRRKAGLREIAPEFEDFRSFLRHMGPKPVKGYSVERIDNSNRTYGPGLVEWRSAKDQANNRSSTVFLTHDGETLPLTEWAARTGQRPDTLRKRRRRGYTDEEVIFGRGIRTQANAKAKVWPGRQTPERSAFWERHYFNRGAGMEGLTRVEFFLEQAAIRVSAARIALKRQEEMLAYLLDGVVPPGMTELEADMALNDTLMDQTPEELERRAASNRAFIARIEAAMNEAEAMLPADLGSERRGQAASDR